MEKMKILGTRNFGMYVRKMLIDGYIIKVDYSKQRKLAAEVNKIGVNINQICKRINSTDRVYSEDVAELRKRMNEVRKLLCLNINRIKTEFIGAYNAVYALVA